MRPGCFAFDHNLREALPIDSVSFSRSGLRDTLLAASVTGIQKSFPGLTPADTLGTDVNGRQVRLVDISGFYWLHFDTAAEAESAISVLRANGNLRLVTYSNTDWRTAEALPPGACCYPNGDCTVTQEQECWEGDGDWLGPLIHSCSPYPCEPLLWEWPACPADSSARPDPLWPIHNRGMRVGMENCGDAISGVGIHLDYSRWPLQESEFSVPVIGCVDTGISDAHEDLNVVSLSAEERALIQVPWMQDYCGRHGTNMSGLAAAKAFNQVGIVGVCNNCRLLDIAVPHTSCFPVNCDEGDSLNCDKVGDWPSYVENAFSPSMSVHPTVLNLEFGDHPSLDPPAYMALWRAFQRQVPIIAPTGNETNTAPVVVAPAGVPHVLGVGGLTWEDKFWTSSTSCYLRKENGVPTLPPNQYGTTIGRGNVDICAPAAGPVYSTYPVDNPECPSRHLPYGWTSGQNSGASALVAGIVGYLQAKAFSHAGSTGIPDADEREHGI